MAVSAFSGLQGSPITWDGYTVNPGGADDLFGIDMAPGHYRHHRADLLITLMDVWVINPMMLKVSGMNAAHWIPVDCEPLGAIDAECLRITGARPIAMSRHGERMLQAAGFDCLYVPHGIDTETFRPPEDRNALRREAGVGDRFVVGINAANQ